MRKNAREAVYKLLFSNQFNGKFDDEFKSIIYAEEKLNDDDIEFANSLLESFYANEETVNEIISNLAKGYKLERLYSTDKCALQLAITEMTYFKDIPRIVSISEAMELIRKFSTKESPNFVNGILAEYKKQLEN
ncbi:MAG: transcription antitermination factor NusB [Clostridia bacterium]|nr:transcription antitermination factor NusB [Clostridia bacterium]